jgi:hypothetical protein
MIQKFKDDKCLSYLKKTQFILKPALFANGCRFTISLIVDLKFSLKIGVLSSEKV